MNVNDAETVVRWLWAHRGHPDPSNPINVEAWHEVLDDDWIELEDVLDVLVEHHRSGVGSFLMPFDIRVECMSRVATRLVSSLRETTNRKQESA